MSASSACGSCAHHRAQAGAEQRNVLPTHAVPVKYTMHLQPDLESFVFKGHVDIDMEVREGGWKTLTMHAVELEFQKVQVNGKEVTSYEFDSDLERVTLNVGEELQKGTTVRVSIDYTGTLNDRMQGFYRSGYTHTNGEKRYMAVTQFEDTDCRRCVPCFDEPEHKAVFKCSLTVPSDRTCLSNMDPERVDSSSDGTLKTYSFLETPRMSTYLLAFCVADMDYVEAFSKNGTRVRVYTPVGAKEKGMFALDVGVRCLELFEEFFDIKFPLPKIDHVSVRDFAMGAMENFGLITYRETVLLVDENSSLTTKQWVALVVCHELSHQWFGNLVTMRWWNGLFLNESFATLAEYWATDQLFPEWEILNQFVALDYMAALRLDALESSHPIDVPITSEKQVKEIFDNISYAKGCSVLRMLINYLGQDVYRVGIRKYLNKFLWRNADPEDLWSTLSEVSGKDVSAMMDAWTKKTGYPVVISKGSDASGVLQLTQRRFLSSGRILSDADPGNPVWHIPLDDGTIATTRQFSYKPYDGQVKLNRGQFGVFRVLYSDDEWHRICAALADRKLSHCVDRLALGNDAFALAKAGLLNAGTALSVIRALGHPDERDNNVWGEVASAVSAFRQLLFGSEFEDRFRRFAIGMFKPLLPAVSWQKSEGESANISLLRPIVISALCSFGDPETVAEARRLFQNDRQNILPDLRSTVYCAVVRSFNMVDEVIAVMRGTDVQEEQVRCLRALSCTRDLPSVQRVLSMALDTQVVRSQDVMFITGTMAGEWSTGRDQVWSWIQTNWAELTRRYAESGAILGRILQGSLSGFLSPEKLHEVKEFVAAHPIQTIEMTMRQTIEAIENGVAWKNRDFPKVTQWLSASGF